MRDDLRPSVAQFVKLATPQAGAVTSGFSCRISLLQVAFFSRHDLRRLTRGCRALRLIVIGHRRWRIPEKEDRAERATGREEPD